MNIIKWVLLLFFTVNLQAQKKQNQYWIDENGKSIDQELFLSKWRSETSTKALWNYSTKDSSKVSKLSHDIFEFYTLDSKLFLNYFNKVSRKKFSDSTIFIIEYHFKDDLCSNQNPNYWSKADIDSRKHFTDKVVLEIEKFDKNTVYLVFFENGITLRNSPNKNEYYFTDEDNFLRKTVFLHPTLCGSFLVTKPDGSTLVRNGEFRADNMLEYLKPVNWNSIFENK